MEEDIEELEEIKKSIDTDYGSGRRKVQAIDNIINRNKELEEENRIFTLEGCRVRLKMYIDKNYIPKSKIKENIEELKQEKEYYYSDYKIEELNNKIQVLQELLGEEK